MLVGSQIACSDTTLHTRKVRIGCPRENVHPRAGYRLIFQVLSLNGRVFARMLDVYYKQQQADIQPNAVERLAKIAPEIVPENQEPTSKD